MNKRYVTINENPFDKILKLRKSIENKFSICNKYDDMLDFITSKDENFKTEDYPNEILLREYFINNYLKKRIISYRNALIKSPLDFKEFKGLISGKYQIENAIEIYSDKNIFFNGDLGVEINTNPNTLVFEDLEKRLNENPKNLIGIVNSQKLTKDIYYGTPIIFKTEDYYNSFKK